MVFPDPAKKSFRIRISEISHICVAGVRKWTEGGGGDAHDSHERERDQLRPGHQDCRPPDPSGKTPYHDIFKGYFFRFFL